MVNALPKSFKNINILNQITANNGNETISIYTPSIGYDSAGNPVEYSGFVTSLRLMVDIKSIDELVLPERQVTDTEEQRYLRERDVILESPRKGVEILLKLQDEEPIVVSQILLFNRYPYYWVELIRYLSSSNTFDCAPGTSILLRMTDEGYGLLEQQDKVTVIGSVVEETGLIKGDTFIVNPLPSNNQGEPSNIEVIMNNQSEINNDFEFGN